MPARDDVRSPSSAGRRSPTVKFPDFIQEHHDIKEEDGSGDISREPSPTPLPNGLPAGLHSSKRWAARKQTAPARWSAYTNGSIGGVHSRPHQKSLTEAIRNVRNRKMSMSEKSHEIAESLKAPVSFKLVVRIARPLDVRAAFIRC